MNKKGKLISIEGIEATGKSTIVSLLAEKLRKDGLGVETTREPGGTKFAEEVRELIMDNEIDVITELLLFCAARRNHLEFINNKLYSVDYVITDRFSHSTIAYQGYGYGMDIEKVKLINDIATNNQYPDITFLIDLPVEISLKRKSQVEEQNRLDKMSIEFYEKVRIGFKEMAVKKEGNIVIIDGKQSIEKIVSEIYEYLKEQR